jgi:dTDP-4-dehydrorhamnose reductase
MTVQGAPVCLVTGADGKLGRALRHELARRGLRCHAPADLDAADAAAVARAIDAHAPDWVFNAAAYTNVDACESHPEEARRANAVAPGVLAQACKGRALLVHVSTEYVFPGEAHRPIPEDAPARPLSVYGQTKWDGEEAVRSVGPDHLIVRTQWLFGDGPCFVRTIVDLARRGEPLRVVEDQLGRPTSAQALAQGLLDAARLGVRGTLHLACAGIASWYDFACCTVNEGAERGLNPRVPIEPIPSEAMSRPARRPPYGVLALEKARGLGIGLPRWQAALEAFLDEEVHTRG